MPVYMVPLYKQAKSSKQFQKGLHMAHREASSESWQAVSSQLLPDVGTILQRVCMGDLKKFFVKESKY